MLEAIVVAVSTVIFEKLWDRCPNQFNRIVTLLLGVILIALIVLIGSALILLPVYLFGYFTLVLFATDWIPPSAMAGNFWSTLFNIILFFISGFYFYKLYLRYFELLKQVARKTIALAQDIDATSSNPDQ